MSLNATTLNGAITATQTRIKLTSGTGVAVGSIIRVDDEKMLIQDISLSPVVDVARGWDKTTAAAHPSTAVAVIGLPADFKVRDGYQEYSYSVAGTIPHKEGLHKIYGSGALAMLLADPTADENGMELEIVAAVAQAHTVSNVGGSGFNAGGTASDLGTYGGAIGDGMRLKAIGSKWVVLRKTNVTLA